MTEYTEKMEKTFALSRTLLKFTGLLPDENGNLNKPRIIMYMILAILMFEIGINEIVFKWPNYSVVLLIITMFEAQFYCFLKLILYLFHYKKITELSNTVRNDFWAHDENSTDDEKKVIEKYGRQAYHFNIFQAGLFMSHGIFASSKQIIYLVECILSSLNIINHVPKRVLMYKNFYGPHIDTYADPYYEILFSIQVFGLLYYLILFSAIDTLFVYLVLSTTGQMKLIQVRIEKFYEEESKGHERYLNKCISHHQRICQFCQELETCFSTSLLLQVAVISSYVCISLYCTLVFMETHPTIVLYKTIGISVATCQLFSYFYASDLLTSEGLNIAQAAYNSNWVQASNSTKKSIGIIITRAQKPIYLTAAGFMPASLSSFEMVMHSAFSYFTVLKTMMSDE